MIQTRTIAGYALISICVSDGRKDRHMKKTAFTFTVFDFETTGLYPYSGDRICEIGAIRMEASGREKIFHSMVDPERKISRGAFFVNRITPDMLKGAPKINEILPEFLAFIKGSVLVAYNAGFDMGFLESAMGGKKRMLDGYRVIDALVLARKLFPGMRRYNLGSVALALNVAGFTEHRALQDARMTLEIFKKELEALSKDGKSVFDLGILTRPKKKSPIKTVKDYKVEVIKKAILEEKKLNITYLSSWRNRMTDRTITPKKIHEGYKEPYVVAHCHLRNKRRNFKLDSIIRLRQVG